MSFSKEIKKEILENNFNSKQQALAFLCGLIYSSAEYEVVENQIQNFIIVTEIDFLCDFLQGVVNKYFGSQKLSSLPIFKIGHVQYVKIMFPSTLAEELLISTRALTKKGKNFIVNPKVDDAILSTEDGLKGFMCGTFVGCGTSSIKLDEKERTSTGYHLEIASQNYELLHEITNVLAQYEILAKLTQRKNLYVLYIKDAEEVSNALALMGASNAVLNLQNEIITRQMRNKVNRQNNCYTSNYSKTLNASFNQLEAINIIDKEVGLNTLPEDLQQVALLRLANGEESLDELLKLSKIKLTKSALNYKFQKLIKMANKLKGKTK